MWLSAILYIVILFLLYKYFTYRPENFPPGPIGLPIWGAYPYCLLRNWNFPHDQFHRWAKRYGSVIGLYFGPIPVIVTCDYETTKEVLLRPEFDGKPDLLLARYRTIKEKRLGIFFTEGPFWHEQRRFSLRHLRDYGFGRRFEKLESLMDEQIRNVIEYIKYAKPSKEDSDILKDGFIYLPDIFYPCMMNAIMSMFGMELALPDTEKYRQMRDVGRAVLKLQRSLYIISILNVTPWMRFIAPNITGYNRMQESNKVLFPYFKRIIEENRKTKMDDDEFRNFCDEYESKLAEDEEYTTFSDDQLLMITIDYMFPAVTAVPVVTKQIIFSLLNHPDVQARVQAELDDIVGRGRLPTLDDRKDMPYTEAVIREVLRKETLNPLGLPHRVMEDTKLKGYDIPKGTMLLTSIGAAHNDVKIWGDPENFRPERFLDSSGKLLKKDYSIPFGAGKRLCAGETFARNSLFLLTTALFQNFNFHLLPGARIPKMDDKIPGVLNDQKDECWLKAVSRD